MTITLKLLEINPPDPIPTSIYHNRIIRCENWVLYKRGNAIEMNDIVQIFRRNDAQIFRNARNVPNPGPFIQDR